jgi:hypothetical protein
VPPTPQISKLIERAKCQNKNKKHLEPNIEIWGGGAELKQKGAQEKSQVKYIR